MLRPALWSLAVALLLVVALLLFWKYWFLRQPVRAVPAEGIVSPASGKIVRIVRFEDGTPQEIPKGAFGTVRTLTSDVGSSGYVIVIMLSPLDVHYQRSPLAGRLVAQSYTEGAFRNAVLGARELGAIENEKNEMLFDTARGKIKVVQVAGFLARRIESFIKEDARVEKGDVIGLINMGSQVLLIIPDTDLKIVEGQRVIDGETVIA